MRASRSRSKARNAARSAAAVGGSTALRRSGRSRMIVVTGPFVSLRTPGRSITCILLARHGTHGCPCAVCDVGGKFQPRKHNGSCDRGWGASPSAKGKAEDVFINCAHLGKPGSKHFRLTAEAQI